MDHQLIERMQTLVAGSAPRRQAARALAGSGLAAVATRFGLAATGAKKRKHRCRKQGQTCDDTQRCCKKIDGKAAHLQCQQYPAGECRSETDRHCCGLEGTPCDPNFGEREGNGFGNCSCCPPLFCGKQKHGVFRCQTEDT